MLTDGLQCFAIGIHMSVYTVTDMLVLNRSKYFVWSCLISHLLEARGKHFWFEAIDIIVLEGGQDICIVGVSCGYLEVVIVNSKISGECV